MQRHIYPTSQSDTCALPTISSPMQGDRTEGQDQTKELLKSLLSVNRASPILPTPEIQKFKIINNFIFNLSRTQFLGLAILTFSV